MLRRIYVCWIIFWGFFGGLAHGQVIEDYSEAWKEGEVNEWFSSSDWIYQWVNIRSFPEAYFAMEIPKNTLVFEGDRLWLFAEKDTLLLTPIKSLREEFLKDSLLISYYNEGFGVRQPLIQKVATAELVNRAPERLNNTWKTPKESRQQVRDFFILAVLISLFLLVIFRHLYPYVFFVILNPRSLVKDEDFSESAGLQKFFSMDILLLVFIVNLFCSLAAVMGLVFFKGGLIQEWVASGVFGLVGLWLVGALVLLIVTILKFLGIRGIATLFTLNRVEYPHFFYLLRLLLWFHLLVAVLGFFYLMNVYHLTDSLLYFFYQVFFWGYILGIGFLFFSMMKHLSFKKYHLFIYLCIAELVPFLILVKWILVTGHLIT